MHIARIVSGGQTGVDRAALDFAIRYGIEHGGWVPKGRKTENGPLPSCYNMRETETPYYRERTGKNVLESDGTLILFKGRLLGGTLLTYNITRKSNKPVLVINMGSAAPHDAAASIKAWIEQNRISVLNVAGPRESQFPGIYSESMALLVAAFAKSPR